MRAVQRAIFFFLAATATAALAISLVGTRAAAAGSAAPSKAKTVAAVSRAASQNAQDEVWLEAAAAAQADGNGKISGETMKALGVKPLPKGVTPKDVARLMSKKITQGNPEAQVRTTLPPGTGPGGASPVPVPGTPKVQGGQGPPLVGQPPVLDELSALSAALITTVGGRENQFSEVALIADWDGREDCAGDRGAKIDDFSGAESEIDSSLTRAAISEHTFANGHLFNSYYYGDSVGNFWFGFDLVGNPFVDVVFQANLPAIVNTPGGSGGFVIANPTAGDCMDDQVMVTGIAVNPVADLGDFDAALCGVTGEVIYVSVFDAEGCASNAANQPIRTRIFAIAIFEIGGTEFVVANVRQVLRSKFSNIAGIAVDDDGSLYYQLVDLIQFTGGAIFKATEVCRTVTNCGAANPRINRVITSIPDAPTLNSWVNSTSAPPTGAVVSGGSRHTNYGGGLSSLFGDIVSLANGGCNVLYSAVSRSFVAGDLSFEQLTQGLFPAPSAFGAAGTPSMIISFADCSGAFDACTGLVTPLGDPIDVGGILPVADGFADVAQSGLTRTPGVNNFRIFAQGNGPNLAPAAGGTAIVPGTPTGLLKVDMQVDYTLYSGLAVNEQNTVFVISGGAAAGIGKNPSPMLGEVLCFEDGCPADRRADFVDLRGDALSNPPASGGNVGDGDSDRFDHIFYQAPLDQLTLTPAGLAGLARGFLRYTNRLAPTPISPGVTLGFSGVGGIPVQGDEDTTSAVVVFEDLDPGHQVAGGDDQNTPFRGDDDNAAGNPVLVGPLSGGFEFVFGGPVGTANCVWNGLFLNSNGNITFGSGSVDNTPTVPGLRVGPPRIAPAWTDLNPSARAVSLCTFPVQALGFADVNAFKVRWINVPQFGDEGCTTNASNTFSVTLFDDGTGIDENANQPLNPANPIGNNAVPFDLQEGPPDSRFTREPNTLQIVGCLARPSGSGIIIFDYCRMDLLGTEGQPVLTGYSIGNLSPLNPPGLCEINMSVAAAAADTNPFGVLTGTNGQTANICANCCIGEGTEPTLFELFNEGLRAGTGSGGEITFAKPDFDLRFEGNDAVLCTSTRQRDLNRGRVCLFGVGCAPPANPQCLAVVPGTFVTTPTTTGLINALCAVQLNLVGCGFYPNEVTTICQGFTTETGVPLQRPGKTVTTAAVLRCDTDGDGILEATITLGSVTPVNCNLVRATLVPLASRPGTAFPDACCGGPATIVVTTTFTAGDNNVFGPFTRTTTCSLNLGTRAPVVFSVTPADGNCAVSQDLLISGACFCFTQANPGGTPNPIIGAVTSVIFQDAANPANRITVGVNPSASGQVRTLTCQLLDVEVNFTSANAGKTFLVFVVGTGGTSRNLTAAVAGAPAGCPLGNEQGFQVKFTCASSTTPGPGPTPDIALVNGCQLDRNPAGNFILDVFGRNLKPTADVRVGSITPRRIKAREPDPSFPGGFLRITLKGEICNGLPGNIVVTNPPSVPGGPTVPSQPFACTERCPVN